MSGRIEVIYGPMFSGKSSELIRQMKRFSFAKKKCLIVNYAHDNRYSLDATISTHDKIQMQAKKCVTLSEIDNMYDDYDVIAIDEGQFFQDVILDIFHIVLIIGLYLCNLLDFYNG
jgi:thymidine kinase